MRAKPSPSVASGGNADPETAAACANRAGFRFRLIAFTASPISAGVKTS